MASQIYRDVISSDNKQFYAKEDICMTRRQKYEMSINLFLGRQDYAIEPVFIEIANDLNEVFELNRFCDI